MRELVLGMDLQTEYSQLCYFDEEQKDAVDVKEGSEGFLYNDLFFLPEDKSWHFGLEAQELYLSRKGQYFQNIIGHLGDRKVIIVDGKEYDYMDLFAILLQLQIASCFPEEYVIKKLVISCESPDMVLLKAIHVFAKRCKLKPDQVELTSYTNATLFYIFSQPSSVWGNGAGVFQYDSHGLSYQKIEVKRYTKPMQVEVKNYRVPDMAGEAEVSDEEKDARFAEICRQTFREKGSNVSSVYLLGEGFEGDWLNQSATALCRGRRVFVGQNMYAKGACFCAQSGSTNLNKEASLYVKAPGMVHYDIGVKADYQGKEHIIPIALGDQEWFNIKGRVSVFLDETDRIEMDLFQTETRTVVREVIEIHGLPKRPPKTTKLEIQVRYLSPNRGEIVIRDKGFGVMYPMTGKIYRKEFLLPQKE